MDTNLFIPDNYGWYLERFRPGLYREAFEEYCRVSARAFEALEKGEVSPEEASRQLMGHCAGLIKWPGKKLKIYDLKCLLSLFTSPAAELRGSAEAADFARILNETWNNSYPKEPYKSGDYETLAAGFREKKMFGFKMAED